MGYSHLLLTAGRRDRGCPGKKRFSYRRYCRQNWRAWALGIIALWLNGGIGEQGITPGDQRTRPCNLAAPLMAWLPRRRGLEPSSSWVAATMARATGLAAKKATMLAALTPAKEPWRLRPALDQAVELRLLFPGG